MSVWCYSLLLANLRVMWAYGIVLVFACVCACILNIYFGLLLYYYLTDFNETCSKVYMGWCSLDFIVLLPRVPKEGQGHLRV